MEWEYIQINKAHADLERRAYNTLLSLTKGKRRTIFKVGFRPEFNGIQYLSYGPKGLYEEKKGGEVHIMYKWMDMHEMVDVIRCIELNF